MKKLKQEITRLVDNVEGRVGPPLLLYFLGVPGGICLVLWLLFWRGK